MNKLLKNRISTASQEQWQVMTFYERFEQVVALVLSATISVVIVISLWQLIRNLVLLLVLDTLNPLDYSVFQTIFGMIMTLLIAMEFKHSIIRVVMRRDHIIQVKTVILIALLALARKFIILEPNADPAHIAALSGAVLVLGMVYWLVCDRDAKSFLAGNDEISGSISDRLHKRKQEQKPSP